MMMALQQPTAYSDQQSSSEAVHVFTALADVKSRKRARRERIIMTTMVASLPSKKP